MGVIFTPGQILGQGDLDIFLTNAGGNPTNAAEMTYAIYYVDPGPPEVEVLIGSATRTPVNPAVGEYFASLMVPPTATTGDYRIKWTMREFVGAPQQQVVQEWGVVDPAAAPAANPLNMTPQEAELVECLRILLRDWNPDKHYHFCPPEHESQIGQYNRVFGFVWEDLELLHYLRTALNWWNMFPPNSTGITCSLTIMMTTPFTASWQTAILWIAIVHAMFALARNWVHEEFDYSIGGISLSINKSSSYESLKSNAEGMADKAVEAKKDTTLIIRGLQQPKYGIGIRSSFGPHVGSGVLSPRAFLVWGLVLIPLLPVLAALSDLGQVLLQV